MSQHTAFDAQFIESLPKNAEEALLSICTRFKTWYDAIATEKRQLHSYGDIIDAYGFLVAFLRRERIGDSFTFVLTEDESHNVDIIAKKFFELHSDMKAIVMARRSNDRLSASIETYSSLLTQNIILQFSESDYGKIQLLINELREGIDSCGVLNRNHKTRLLRRLEALQSELHESMSNLDAFWVFVGDAGIVLGQFGEDVKPLVDRVQELWGIVREAIQYCLGLPPADLLALPNNEHSSKSDRK